LNDELDPMEPEAVEGDPFAEAQDDLDLDGQQGHEAGSESGSPRRSIPTAPPALQESIASLDALLAEADEPEKIQAGMGIRLALGMAQELKAGKPLGTDTAELVAGWVHTYGEEVVETAVKVAREFLIKPEEMRKVLGERLGMGNPE
jgi:hypothetical protein